MRVRARILGARGARRMLRKTQFGPWTRRALLRAAFAVQENATTKQIIPGGVFGGVASPPDPDRVTSRTGQLRASIAVDRGGLSSYFIEVGSPLIYAPVHELGNATTPARPYLDPALVEESKGFKRIFVQELERELAEFRGTVKD